MTRLAADRFWLLTKTLAILAGVAYASWPLGYLLNPAASQRGLASALEAVNQPYNWVFISGDIASSALIIVVAWMLWRRLRTVPQAPLLIVVLANIVIFGVATIADTLLPEHCLPGVPSCPNWRQDHILLLHGIVSVVGAFCLFLALALVWWRRRRSRLLNNLMIGYVLFGAVSVLEALTPGQGNWSQHYYITLCGLWLAFIPYVVRRAFDIPANSVTT